LKILYPLKGGGEAITVRHDMESRLGLNTTTINCVPRDSQKRMEKNMGEVGLGKKSYEGRTDTK